MGVVYKLTPNISSFIVEQKQSAPKISCQRLADKVFASFGQRVSKSSVHELLKQAHVIVPRSRVIKEKFQIPQFKKEQISKDLASLMMPMQMVSLPKVLIPQGLPAIVGGADTSELDSRQKHSGMTNEKTQSEPVIEKIEETLAEVFSSSGDIFLRCALWDLSFKPVLGLNDFKDIDAFNSTKAPGEWDYLTQLICAIKIELADNSCFFIDSRFQDLYAQAPSFEALSASIERAACETADYILNNIEPMVIQEYSPNDFNPIGYDLVAAFENLPGKSIQKVALSNSRAQDLAEFNRPLAYKRRFILGISPKHNDFQWVMDQKDAELSWETPLKDGLGHSVVLKVCKKEDKVIITNMMTTSYENIIKIYADRFPSPNRSQLSAMGEQGKAHFSNQGKWLKTNLKERSKMFFPPDFSLTALEDVLTLQAREKQGQKELQVQLLVPQAFAHIQELKYALENVNNLHIKNYQGKIVRVLIGQD